MNISADDFDCYDSQNEENDEEEEAFDEPSLPRQRSFEVLSEINVASEAKKMVDAVIDVLGVDSPSTASALLRHFKWNKEKLIQNFIQDPEKIYNEVGLLHWPSSETEKPKFTNIFCPICFNDYKASGVYTSSCGHTYCRGCWKTYLEMKITDGPECLFAKCMNPECKQLIDENTYKKIVSPELMKSYSNHFLRSFVADNPLVKWCPAPSCTYSIRCERRGRQEAVECNCGFRFCFNCCDYNIGDHMPASCIQVERWLQKASDESENVNWLMANTKRCPQCRAPIEKNGGCMHMSCRKNAGGCGYEFCWLCRGNWSEHGQHTGGYYSCNKYDKSDAKKDDEKLHDVKTALEEYMFYYHRYQSHHNARKIAHDQKTQTDKKGKDLQERLDVRAQDTKFLQEATELLLHNRRVLEYSYVFGYYLDKKNTTERNLFEFLQENLEKNTNHLSELYEKPIEKITDYHQFIKWKEEVTNYTRVTKKFLDNFVQGVASGLVCQE